MKAVFQGGGPLDGKVMHLPEGITKYRWPQLASPYVHLYDLSAETSMKAPNVLMYQGLVIRKGWSE